MVGNHDETSRARFDSARFDFIECRIARYKAIGYAKFYSRSHGALIRVFDESGTVIETHEHGGNFQEP